METETLQIRTHGRAERPTVIYLPGIHGDWTLVSSFRERMTARFRFVEFTYPRTLAWSLEDYARAIRDMLLEHGIASGSLLGESFGSAIAWELLALHHSGDSPGFYPQMLILAGGFVKYPFMPLVDLTRAAWGMMPPWSVRAFFHGYAWFARWRHRHAPETAAAIREFVSRRTMPDLAAMGHRLHLIRSNDPGRIARRTELPVYQLSGRWDPIVFAPIVARWLATNCPGFRQSRVLPLADHNVLGTAPEAAAEVVTRWVELHPT